MLLHSSTKRKEEKAFQAYTILQTNMACKIPDTVPFENAVVLGLGLSTAAAALFNPHFLNLQLLTEPAQKPTGKTLLVWGGASSVGSNAVQLAVAASYEVITTASRKNFEYVKKLGASYRFDYNSPTVISELSHGYPRVKLSKRRRALDSWLQSPGDSLNHQKESR
jgi:NADPH:quinone reductase-like Zn-dependent oxidoreductase